MHTVVFACKSSFFLRETAKLVGSSSWDMNWVRYPHPSMLGLETERTGECRRGFVGRIWTFPPSRADRDTQPLLVHPEGFKESSGAEAPLLQYHLSSKANQPDRYGQEVPLFPCLLSVWRRNTESSAPDAGWCKKPTVENCRWWKGGCG